jgi:hypothetical protein
MSWKDPSETAHNNSEAYDPVDIFLGSPNRTRRFSINDRESFGYRQGSRSFKVGNASFRVF